MNSLPKVHPKILEAVAFDSLFESFTLWAHSGNWAQYLDMKEHISIVVRIDENGKVMAKPVANVLGFSGTIEGMELSLPNDHLHREVMQVLTILEHLPREENINDLVFKVFNRWGRENRDKRNKEIDTIAKQLKEEVESSENPTEKLKEYLEATKLTGSTFSDEKTCYNRIARVLRRQSLEN